MTHLKYALFRGNAGKVYNLRQVCTFCSLGTGKIAGNPRIMLAVQVQDEPACWQAPSIQLFFSWVLKTSITIVCPGNGEAGATQLASKKISTFHVGEQNRCLGR